MKKNNNIEFCKTYVLVKKKDGSLVKFNPQKITTAICKSANRATIKLSEREQNLVAEGVSRTICEKKMDVVKIQDIHNIVENELEKLNPMVAKSYRDYRNYKHDFVEILDDVYKKSQTIMYIGDKENSNTDSALVSTQRSLIFNHLNKKLYQRFFLNNEETQACRDGYIYVHDMSARRDTMNCSLFDIIV